MAVVTIIGAGMMGSALAFPARKIRKNRKENVLKSNPVFS